MSPSGHLTSIEALNRGPHSVDMPIALVAVLLTARFYTVVDISAADRSAATRVTSNILRAAGIEVAWMDCSEKPDERRRDTHATAGRCLTPVNPDEVIVRFVSSPLTTHTARRSADSLGDAYVDTAAATGALATVYVDRVLSMARAAGVDTTTVLGRVTAHEIGHLLLGTASHRQSGLMRAEWSTAMLQRQMATEWRLSNGDAASARAALVRRTHALQASADHAAPGAVPCAATSAAPAGVVCPLCPVCTPRLPTDRMALHLLVEPGF